MRRVQAGSLLAMLIVCGACTLDGKHPKPPFTPPLPEDNGAPIRRLTQEELNRTLADVFAGITIPFVPLSDGTPPPGGGAKFDGDVQRQTPSDLVVEQLRAGVIAVSGAAITRPDLLLPRQPSGDPADQLAVGHELIAAIGPRILRRPFEDGESARYATLFDTLHALEGMDVAVQGVLQALLQSPSFLYRVELEALTGSGAATPIVGYEMASRMSYFLWGTMPDATLFERADDGTLDDVDGVVAEATRMLGDQRAQRGVLSFHRQWLDLDRILITNKDAGAHPSYNEFLRQSMREEADRFIATVIFSGDARLETLLTSNLAPINQSLAGLYGVAPPAQDWSLVSLPSEQRAGLLTQAQFLASRAHAIQPSPVLRGIFVLERFMCETPPPPDGAIDTTPPEVDENEQTTNRDRFARHTFDPLCQSCHVAIDGIGFGLESYNAIGAFRTEDNGLPVDASGTLVATQLGGNFTGARELAERLVDAPSVSRCVAQHWFNFALGRRHNSADQNAITELSDALIDSDGDIRALLVAIVASDAFRTRASEGGP